MAANLDVFRASAEDADLVTIGFVAKFIADLGLGVGLRTFGLREEQFDELATEAFADGCHQTNPVPVTREDLQALYHAAF